MLRQCYDSIHEYDCVVCMLNKNTLGVKKCEVNQKQHASRQVRPKALISVEAKKLATLTP